MTAGAPGTNGNSSDFGDFMLVGIQLREPGCWQVTDSYREVSLSHVIWVDEN